MKLLNQVLLAGCAALLLTGCQSASSKFYTLSATAKSDGGVSADYAVAVGPLSIPQEVDRPQFVVQVSPNQIAVDEFNRWAEPLKDNIARVVSADLATLLGTPRVTSVPLANFTPDYRVSVDIQRFVSNPGKTVQIDALWVVSRTQDSEKLCGHTVAGEQVGNDSFDALAAAQSRALGKISADIAAAIRSEAEAKP